MRHEWEHIADALRQEIGEYGGLLHLFEEQQRLLFAREPEAVMRMSEEIQARMPVVQEARRNREARVAVFAVECGQAPDASLRALLNFFAAEAQPLIDALITEINVLIHRVRKVSRHNHALLQRAMESHQHVLRVLRPDGFIQTYAPNGRVAPLAIRPAPALHVAG